MKILLVQGYLGPANRSIVYPAGLACVGTAAAAAGHEVRIVDPNVMPEGIAGLRRAVEAYRPDGVGISFRNVDNQSRLTPVSYYGEFKSVLRLLREAAGNRVPIVAGGAGFSMFAREIMERNPELDFGVYLEGEESFPELLGNLGAPESVKGIFYRRDGKVAFAGERPLPDFGRLPFPRRELADLAPYLKVPFAFGVQTKRGCSLKCAYCNYPHLNGAAFRLRTAAHVGEELDYLATTLGIREFSFADSVLNIPTEHGAAILREMRSRRLPLRWDGYLHLKGIDREFVQLAKEAGCVSMLFSPDGISNAALEGLGKDLDHADVERTFAFFKREQEFAGIHVGFSYFMTPPGETLRGVLQALAFYVRVAASRLKPRRARMRAYVGWLRLEPHTKAYERAIAEGTVSPALSLLPDDERELRRVFYRHPTLSGWDPILLGCFRLLRTAERLVKRLLAASRNANTKTLYELL